jgi:hypothetical protein
MSVEYHADFKLFLTTRLANPMYPSELLTKAVLINWIVTVAEVAERLLSLTVNHERVSGGHSTDNFTLLPVRRGSNRSQQKLDGLKQMKVQTAARGNVR